MGKTVLLFLLSVLGSIAFMFYSVKNKPIYHDGPYLNYIDSTQMLLIRHFCDDGIIVRESREQLAYKKTEPSQFTHPCNKKTYVVKHNFVPQSTVYQDVSQILALPPLSDIDDVFIRFLQNNKVIDAQQNWIWGNGHLVLLGNVLHRGDKNTDYLWLIYKLEQQAKQAGGAVHYLLGNHEVRTMLSLHKNSGHIFAGTKQKFLAEQKSVPLEIDSIFDADAFFGRWLRSKNVAVQINDYLFCQGGISLEIMKEEHSIAYVNEAMRANINRIHWDTVRQTKYPRLLSVVQDPTQYSRYLGDLRNHPALSTTQIDSILQFYGVEALINAHPAFPDFEIVSLHRQKVYSLSVPMASDYAEGLLILSTDKRRLLLDGTAKWVTNK